MGKSKRCCPDAQSNQAFCWDDGVTSTFFRDTPRGTWSAWSARTAWSAWPSPAASSPRWQQWLTKDTVKHQTQHERDLRYFYHCSASEAASASLNVGDLHPTPASALLKDTLSRHGLT